MGVETSDIFKEVVCNASSIVITCEFCDRIYFNSLDGVFFEEGELEDLLLKAKEEPDKYIDTESTHWGRIEGKQVVVNCCCNSLRKYEDFIWSHRYIITEYLKARAKDEYETAKKELNNVKELNA